MTVLFSMLFGTWLLVIFAAWVNWLIAKDVCYSSANEFSALIRVLCLPIPLPFLRWWQAKRIAKENNWSRFSAKQIITFAETAPKKWYFKRNTKTTYKYWFFTYKTDSRGCYYNIAPKTIFDYWALVHYFKNREKTNNKFSSNVAYDKQTAELLTYFKQDAANAQQEAEKAMGEKEKELREILDMLPKSSPTH